MKKLSQSTLDKMNLMIKYSPNKVIIDKKDLIELLKAYNEYLRLRDNINVLIGN